MSAASVRGVVVECLERCGETFTLPAELVSADPASRGQSTIKVRVSLDIDHPYAQHMMGRYTMPDEL